MRRLFFLASFFGLALMGAGSTKSLEALRVREGIQVDGRLAEPVWKQATAVSGFLQNAPEFGRPSAQNTEVRVLYDSNHVYVGARMHHPKGQARIVRQVHRRDQDSASDWFGVYLDSLHDRRTAYAFMVNAAGVQQDRVCYADTAQDSSWDGVWESAVTTDGDGWTAELKIPLALLRLRAQEAPQTWGINFIRADYGLRQEVSLWEVAPRGANAFVSYFPELTGIQGLKPQPRREWLPFVSAQRKFETAQPFDDRGWTYRAGLDAHLGLSSNAQLDLSLKPDFGQVEVDQYIFNLSDVETFIPEKRPFFLEGMEIFQVAGPQLFYSRRIGKAAPFPTVDEAAGEVLLDRPLTTEILGAAKYTAKFGTGTNLGVLAATLEPARATLRSPSGSEFRQEVYPLTHAGVLRATQALDDHGSYLGGFFSYLHQAGSFGREAQVGSADGLFKSADRSTLFDFNLALSAAGPAGEELRGHFQRLRGRKQWAKGFSADLLLVNTSRDFNPNDLGFVPRPDRQQFFLQLDQRWDAPYGIFRNRRWSFYTSLSQDQNHRAYERYAETWFRTEFQNQWSIILGAGGSLPIADDRELRTFRDPVKKYLPVDAHPWFFCFFDTPTHYRWSASARNLWDRFRDGSTRNHTLAQSIRPLPNLEIQLDTSYWKALGEWRWLETQGDLPIVGLRSLSQLDQTLRVSYAFSPTLTVQFFSQWLDAAWAFRDLRRYVSEARLEPGATAAQTAFSQRMWNLNLISRWEFRPGSALFLVYTHGAATDEWISDNASIRPRLDLSALRHLPSDDVVQVKLSWLFR